MLFRSPLLLVGTGGKYVEVLKDVELGVTPLTDIDAKDMVQSIRGYALLKGAHVRTDMLWERFSERTKGWIDFTSYVLLFYPVMITLFVISVDDAWYAFTIGETSEQSPWRPILWPYKMVIPLTCLLLLLQGVSELIKSLHAARTGVELEHKEKVEV